jgi:hypothetical protein
MATIPKYFLMKIDLFNLHQYLYFGDGGNKQAGFDCGDCLR